jgi:hypothetical protein
MTVRARLSSLLAVLSLASAGCADRTHLTPTHGRAYRTALERQAANPEAAPGGRGREGKQTKGLDSQEAAIVARTYRRNLGPAGTSSAQEQQMLLVAPSREAAPNLPPPSVPDRR